eukprot:1138270-Pelagomonas_calceolata.AAC.3
MLYALPGSAAPSLSLHSQTAVRLKAGTLRSPLMCFLLGIAKPLEVNFGLSFRRAGARKGGPGRCLHHALSAFNSPSSPCNPAGAIILYLP